MTYEEFLHSKVKLAESSGFTVDDSMINPALKPHNRIMVKWMVEGGRRACFAAFGLHKCHGAGTPILMADGSIKKVEEVVVGDRLMGDDSTPREVLELATGREMLYQITLKNGDTYTCNESHILSLKVSNRYGTFKKGEIVNMPLREYLKLPGFAKLNCFKQYKVPVEFNNPEPVPMDPYLYGTWLGDGFKHKLSWCINSCDSEIAGKIKEFAANKGLEVREEPSRGCTNFHLSRVTRGSAKHIPEFYFVQESYKPEGKRIDRRYLTNSRETRLKLLAGIIDTDGNLRDGCFRIGTKWEGLRDDILFLARSLGFSVSHSFQIVNEVKYYTVCLSGNTHEVPCLTRKKAEVRKQIKNPLVYGFSVKPIGEDQYYGFTIDGNHLYLLGDFTVTHNTVTQLEVIRLTLLNTGGRGLIIMPLSVVQEFQNDAVHLLGWPEPPKFIRRIEEAGETGIYLTNYETVRDGKLDPRLFKACSLDEAAILRGFGGTKTFREFMRLFTGDAGPKGDRRGKELVKYRFVATATPSPNDYIELLAYADFLGIMDVSQAKAQPLDAKILTPTGWVQMGSLNVGDEVICVDGIPTKVLGVYPQGKRPIYKVTMSDGSSTECDAEHLWLTHTQYERNNERKYLKGVGRKSSNHTRDDKFATVKTTSKILESLTFKGRRHNHSIPLCKPIQFLEKDMLINPWLMGLLIGDGYLRKTSVIVSSADEWCIEKIKSVLPDGLKLFKSGGKYDYSISTNGKRGGTGYGKNIVLEGIKKYGLVDKRAWDKRIPTDYLYNSIANRIALLQGLMDADGTIHNDGTSFSLTTTSTGLVEDIITLVQSLGGIATPITKQSQFTYKGEKKMGRTAYKITMRLPNEINPFSLPRKKDKVKYKKKWLPVRYITSIEYVGEKEAQCIAIEHPSRLYVTDNFIVTHNTRFFKRDSTQADKLTLHKHKEEEFWLWVASWGLFVLKPSDLTGDPADDEGYIMPEMDLRWHELPTDHADAGHEKNGQGKLFKDPALNLQDASREKRDSLNERINKMLELRNEDIDAHRIIWHDLESEREAIEKAIPTITSVYGALDLESRVKAISGFSNGTIQELAAKPVMLGSGCNLQKHCHWAIYLGIGFKFNDFIQSIHRLLRFLQQYRVRVDLIYTEAERGVRKTLERKWEQHNIMVKKMTEIIKHYGLSHAAMAQVLTRKMGVERVEIKGKNFTLINNDNVLECRRLEDNSIGLMLTSWPFTNQYEYSPNYADFGHSSNPIEFFTQMDYLTPETYRALMPGRLYVVHVKDRVTPAGLTGLGFQTVYPFHIDCYNHMIRHGFEYMGMKTIVTDVVRENNQTYRLGWTEQCKDGTKMGVGMPEYLLYFRKPVTDTSKAYADIPVVKKKKYYDRAKLTLRDIEMDDELSDVELRGTNQWINEDGYSRARWQIDAHGFARSNGNRPLTPEEYLSLDHKQIFQAFKQYSLNHIYDFEYHVKVGETLEAAGKLPSGFMLLQPQSWSDDVWTDVTRMRTLNSSQWSKGKEMHLCPLQFDIGRRCIKQLSNPGDKVLDMFSGLGTVPMLAVEEGRYGIGYELNPNYFLDSAVYCKAAEQNVSMPTLFDTLKETA